MVGSGGSGRRRSDADLLIAGAYEVEWRNSVAGGGGLASFNVIDHRHGRRDLMAVQVKQAAPARALPLSVLTGVHIENLLVPLAHGRAQGPDGGVAWFVVTPQPPGAVISAPADGFRPWSERELVDFVLRPAALVLDALATLGVSHRAIRPDNMFQPRGGQPVTLGCAWAGPPACLQPAVFEPPYAAMCHPSGRGEGTIADDVYALGVLLITLAGGRLPMSGLDDDAVIRRKLELGSFAAISAGFRLPSVISDLARGMLAEDPDHRPLPVLLADPMAARARRVAARPTQRAQRALEIGDHQIWDARTLGYAIARAPEAGVRLLRGLDVENWLRRSLGDAGLGARIEEAVRSRAIDHATDSGKADALLVMRAAAILDPLAPLCWRGLALQPDGIGTLIAHVGPRGSSDASVQTDMEAAIQAIVQLEAPAIWANAGSRRDNVAAAQIDARQLRLLLKIAGWAGGLPRLAYALNPLLPCRSALVGGDCVVRLQDLMPALEANAGAADFVVDQEVAAFISARSTNRMDQEFVILSQTEDADIDPPGHRGLAQLRILARLCAQDESAAWPALARAALRPARPALTQWRSLTTRSMREAGLVAAVERGSIAAMLTILENQEAHARDADGVRNAEQELGHIAHELHHLAARKRDRALQAQATGQEVAAAIGIMVLAISAVVTALP